MNSRTGTLLALAVGAIVAIVGVAVVCFPGLARGDATNEYPIPGRMIETACSPEQIMAAARDIRPIYYERYMIDYNNKPLEVQQQAQERIRWFYSQTPEQRRAYSEEMATDIYVENLTFTWPNWAKLFWNNKGVAAATTDICATYPRDDSSVWHW